MNRPADGIYYWQKDWGWGESFMESSADFEKSERYASCYGRKWTLGGYEMEEFCHSATDEQAARWVAMAERPNGK